MLACGLSLSLAATSLASPLPQVSTAALIQAPVRLESKILLVTAQEDEPSVRSKSRTPASRASKRSKTRPTGWVKPVDIVARLTVLESIGVTQQWSGEAKQLVELLLAQKKTSSIESGMILEQFSRKVMELDQIVAVISQRFPNLPEALRLTSELQRLRYDVTKRLAIWKSLHQLGPAEQATASPFALVAGTRISFDQFDDGWKNFLKLTEVEKSFSALNPNSKAQKKAARESLIRLYSPALDTSQTEYIHQMLNTADIQLLKDAASGPVDHHRLIKAIEKFEHKPSGLAAHYINDQFQNLLWSDDPRKQLAAEEIQTHYRNANIRLAVSDRMLNRLIPSTPSVHQPVNERVLGADVNGHSQIQNSLSVQLVPDPSRLHLQLKTDGRVDSDTVATKSGFELRNSGLAKFQGFKRFAIDRFGNFDGQRSVAHANAKQRLIGIRSKLDPFPVVNWVARRIARKKVAEQAPRANMVLEEKVEDSARQQLEEGVREKVSAMQAYLRTNLLSPLVAMDLDPEALETATTPHRLVMRYRLAGLDQMAANSPRPVDAESDYMGVQVHQSLLNNMIERIDISAGSYTPETLMTHLADVIGFNPSAAPTDDKHEATFVFANYDPMRVDLQDGKVRIELNLKSLKVGKKGKTWRNITIASTYTPEVIGSQIHLVQHSPIEVKGRRFRLGDQIAVRAIFTVVLPKEYTFQTIPAQLQENLNGYSLAIEELKIADGWAGLTYNEMPVYNQMPIYNEAPIYNEVPTQYVPVENFHDVSRSTEYQYNY